MVHAMEIHGPESVKSFYEDQHVNELSLPFVTTFNTVVSDTYSDAYNCLTYTDEDVLATEQQRSGLLVQQPRVDIVSGGADDLTNTLINSHRDYRLAVLSTVPTSVQNLDAQCNIVEGLTNYSTRSNANTTGVVVSTPADAWQMHNGNNTSVVTSGHANVGPVPGVNIGAAIGQAGTILGVGTGAGSGVSDNTSSVNGSGHHHHHHHHHHQQQHVGTGSSHNRGSSSSSSPGGATKPKRRRVQTTAQRKAANVRERRRMFHLNEAFDELRKRLPAFNYEKRLSRIETLRLAMTYIGFMKEVTTGKDPCDIELQKYKKLDSMTDCDLDDDDDDDEDEDEENSLGDKHRKSHKRQRKFGFYSKDKHELKDFENL